MRMVSCSFSASSDMVALVLVFAWGVGSGQIMVGGSEPAVPSREKASRSIGTTNLAQTAPIEHATTPTRILVTTSHLRHGLNA